MKLPTDRMLYLVVDAKHAPGELWESPYSGSMTLMSVASVEGKDGWRQAAVAFPEPKQVVGLWLMADGDDTGSTFETRLKDLVLE